MLSEQAATRVLNRIVAEVEERIPDGRTLKLIGRVESEFGLPSGWLLTVWQIETHARSSVWKMAEQLVMRAVAIAGYMAGKSLIPDFTVGDCQVRVSNWLHAQSVAHSKISIGRIDLLIGQGPELRHQAFSLLETGTSLKAAAGVLRDAIREFEAGGGRTGNEEKLLRYSGAFYQYGNHPPVELVESTWPAAYSNVFCGLVRARRTMG